MMSLVASASRSGGTKMSAFTILMFVLPLYWYTDKMSNDIIANDKTASDKMSKDKTANDKMSNATKQLKTKCLMRQND